MQQEQGDNASISFQLILNAIFNANCTADILASIQRLQQHHIVATIPMQRRKQRKRQINARKQRNLKIEHKPDLRSAHFPLYFGSK